MSTHSVQYSIEELLALRESPLVTKPEGLPQMEQWMQPAIDRRNLQNAQLQANGETDSKYRPAEARRSRGDSIILGPPPMSFASSLHSPPLRKTANKDAPISSIRNRPSPPHDDITLSTSPPEEEEEAGWSKVRSAGRGSSTRGFERRGPRSERRTGRESLDGPPLSTKATAFRNFREGESQNWRNERAEAQNYEQTRGGRRDDRAEFLEEEAFDGGGSTGGEGGGKEHSAAEFQAWIAKMRGGNPKSENTAEVQTNDNEGPRNGVTNDQAKADKSKIVDVDSLFAMDGPSVDETSQSTPASSVFFDSAPTGGRASRFRQLFAQEPPPTRPVALQPDRRPSVDRMNSNPLFNNDPRAGASSEDREGFQRIMVMLGGGGGGGGQGGQGGGSQSQMANLYMNKSPPLQSPPMHEGQGQGESKNEFFQRLLRQGQGGGPQSPLFGGPPPPMNARSNGPLDQGRPSQAEMDANMQSRMGRPQPPPHSRSHHSDPRFSPYDLPPPQGTPWMHPPPGFSPPSSRFPFPGPPLSPGLPPPPPPGGFGPPPPGMMPFGGPPPGFGRGVFSPPPPPPPGQDNWHGPPGFPGGFYQEGDGRDR